MNRFHLVIFSSILLLCPFVSMNVSAETTGLQKYFNQEEKFSFEYPSDWTQNSPKFSLVLFAPRKNDAPSHTNMNIYSESVDDSVTLEGVYSETMAIYSTYDTTTTSGDVNINGVPGKWIHVFYPTQGEELQLMLYLFVANNKSYFITFCADSEDFSDHSAEFQKIISSFQLM